MNFYRVAHSGPGDDDDDEPRVAAVIAEDAEQARALCERAFAPEGYERFEVWDSIEGLAFPGPARIIGLEGAPAFSWK
jgi:hypothetical protein